MSLGSELYQTSGYLTFSLLPEKVLNITKAGLITRLNHGWTRIKFTVKLEFGCSSHDFFSLNTRGYTPLLRLARKDLDLVVRFNQTQIVKKRALNAFDQPFRFEITVNSAAISIVNINLDGEDIFFDVLSEQLRSFFIGIAGESNMQHHRSVSIKALSKTFYHDNFSDF